MAAPQFPAGWYDDPLRRFLRRYWDGRVWTASVADAAGTMFDDPLQRSPAAVTTAQPASAVVTAPPTAPAVATPQIPPATATPVADLEALKARLDQAEAAYGELIARARASKMDPAAFHREALRIGVVMRHQDAWFYVLEAQTWFRYDGVKLEPLGGWADGGKT